jgi:hypothetical protein
MIWSQCFTVWNFAAKSKRDVISPPRVAELLQELAANRLIDLYEVESGDKEVLQILQWQERVRDKVKEKWPPNPAAAQKLQQHSGDLPRDSATPPPPVKKLHAPSPSPRSIAQNQSPTPAGCVSAIEDLISDREEAKRLICTLILKGKDPARPWNHEAMHGLEDQLPIPLREIKLIAWFHGQLADDTVHELKVRRRSEGTLMPNWSDEVTRAEAFRKKIGGAGANGTLEKKEPARWREFFWWKYGQEIVLPEHFAQLPGDQLKEWKAEFSQFEAEVAAP